MQSDDEMEVDTWPMHDRRVTLDYRHFLKEYSQELLELYNLYMDCGEQLFGRAFHQTGGFHDFARYTFSRTQPNVRHRA